MTGLEPAWEKPGPFGTIRVCYAVGYRPRAALCFNLSCGKTEPRGMDELRRQVRRHQRAFPQIGRLPSRVRALGCVARPFEREYGSQNEALHGAWACEHNMRRGIIVVSPASELMS